MTKIYQRKQPRSPTIQTAIGNRFILALLSVTPNLAAGARALGYSSPSTIYAIKNDLTLPDLAKVHQLSKLKTEDGKSINIDWVITGRGCMLKMPGAAGRIKKKQTKGSPLTFTNLSEEGQRILHQFISECEKHALFRH